MSVENVKAFFEKVEGDKALQAKLQALNAKAGENRDKEIAELLEIASAAGFEFTSDDFAKARSQKLGISEDEFKTVVVGGSFPYPGTRLFTKLCLCIFPDNSY